MAVIRKINSRAKTDENTGLSTRAGTNAIRFFDKNGTPSVKIRGIDIFRRFSIFRWMLELPTWKFLLFIFLCYLIVNIFFGSIYTFIGVEHLGGMEAKTLPGKFWEAFFFSAQTLSTVGYGHVYPTGFASNTIAAIESLLGLLMFAIATGLMYGRFSQPKSYIRYSKNALFSPYQDGIALMFRFAPYKNHFLSDVEVKVTLAMQVNEDGAMRNRFYNLDLELAKANSLVLSWTIVHPINERSPFYNLTEEEILNSNAEMLVFVKGYDEGYANTVVSRSSYTAEEFIFGARFQLMFAPNPERTHTILDHTLLNAFERVELAADAGIAGIAANQSQNLVR